MALPLEFPIETTFVVPESTAIQVVANPTIYGDQFLIRVGARSLSDAEVRDTYEDSHRNREHHRSAVINGSCEIRENKEPVEIGITYPGFISTALAKLRRREPPASISITVGLQEDH